MLMPRLDSDIVALWQRLDIRRRLSGAEDAVRKPFRSYCGVALAGELILRQCSVIWKNLVPFHLLEN